MFLENLDDFVQQAEELYLKDPLRVRYVLKYKHKEGKLLLKVTDDKMVRAKKPSLAGEAASKRVCNYDAKQGSQQVYTARTAVPTVPNGPDCGAEEGGEVER